MKRREFIKSGLAITVVAGASAQSAFGEIFIPTEENVTQTEIERFIYDTDIRMDRISHSGGEFLEKLISKTSSESEQKFFRSSLRSLLFIGNFGELPIKGQAHPWMQKRMMYTAPEINYSVINSFEILRNMSDKSKEDIRTALTEDRDLGGRILDSLDLEAKSIGVPSARRRQLKIMGRRIIRRMRHSPDMLIDEYVKKTEKLLLASNSDQALEKMFKMQVGEDRYAAYSKEAESAALQWKNSNIHDVPIGYGLMINDQENDGETNETSKSNPRKGLRLLGVGAVLTVVGWLLVSFTQYGLIFGWVLGITIGPILILIALITLIISSAKK
jgi:hypothetical protein